MGKSQVILFPEAMGIEAAVQVASECMGDCFVEVLGWESE